MKTQKIVIEIFNLSLFVYLYKREGGKYYALIAKRDVVLKRLNKKIYLLKSPLTKPECPFLSRYFVAP